MLKFILVLSVSLCISEAFGIFKGGTCPAVKLRFGRARYRQKGRFAKFMCNTGYLIAGEKYSTCVNGTWDGPIPKCVRPTCKKVNPPINGLIYPSHRGAVLNFFCKPGYDLRGPITLYCDGLHWDNNLPSCIVTNTKPSLSCNFETSDLCGWNHDLRHDFDWTRMNFKTPSGHLGTGPSFDHTLGEGKDGYYMYIESSSRNINDTARLISPIYDKMDHSNVCFEFYYHMHGASTGQLRVYLKKLSDGWILIPEKAIFWKMGNHGDQWFHAYISLGPITEDFQIIIEGVRGNSFYSDIAIDDVKIIPNCTVNEITTESDITYTEDYSPTQSCLNRCDNDNNTLTNTEQVSCGCDESCTDNNTCCPDYVALCVLGVTDDSYTTTELTDAPAETSSSVLTTRTTKKTSTVLPKSTLIFLSSTTGNIKNQTIKIPTQIIPSTSTTLKSISTKTTNKQPEATEKKSVPWTTVAPIKSTISSIKPTRVTLSTQPSTSSKPLSSSQKPTNFTKFVAKQKSTTIPTTTKLTSIIDEVLVVPMKSENKDNDDTIPIKINVPNETETVATFNIQNEKIIKEESRSSTTIVVVAVLSVSIILIIVLGAALIKRYRYHSCNRSRINGLGSDSQSDVRFLTSDEILDFNLAYPDD